MLYCTQNLGQLLLGVSFIRLGPAEMIWDGNVGGETGNTGRGMWVRDMTLIVSMERRSELQQGDHHTVEPNGREPNRNRTKPNGSGIKRCRIESDRIGPRTVQSYPYSLSFVRFVDANFAENVMQTDKDRNIEASKHRKIHSPSSPRAHSKPINPSPKGRSISKSNNRDTTTRE